MISFLSNGKTSNDNWIWTSGMLLALDKKEVLAMTVKAIDGRKYLFLEGGGLNSANPKCW